MTALAYERTLKVFAETRDELPLSATSCPSEIGATGVVTDGKRPKRDSRQIAVKGWFTLKADIQVQLVICTPPTRFSR